MRLFVHMKLDEVPTPCCKQTGNNQRLVKRRSLAPLWGKADIAAPSSWLKYGFKTHKKTIIQSMMSKKYETLKDLQTQTPQRFLAARSSRFCHKTSYPSHTLSGFFLAAPDAQSGPVAGTHGGSMATAEGRLHRRSSLQTTVALCHKKHRCSNAWGLASIGEGWPYVAAPLFTSQISEFATFRSATHNPCACESHKSRPKTKR